MTALGRGAMTAAPRLGSVRDAATALRVSTRQIQKLVAAGKLPAPIRLGRSVRFDMRALDEWISAGCPGADDWQAQREGAAR